MTEKNSYSRLQVIENKTLLLLLLARIVASRITNLTNVSVSLSQYSLRMIYVAIGDGVSAFIGKFMQFEPKLNFHMTNS